MAETALFSSFRRPGHHHEEPLAELPATALVTPTEPVKAAPPPEMAEEAPAAAEEHVSAQTTRLLREDGTEDPCHGAWAIAGIALQADQLGLAHPDVIALHARLRTASPVLLEAHAAGIYRPPGFRAAPWSGFAYDQPEAASTGIVAGTRILTARGEVEVEKLVPGDSLMALRGPALLPISWIGRAAAAAAPIWIEAGALGADLPRRRLCLGRDQSVFLAPDPVTALSLVNGKSVLPAEGTPSELFLIDVGRPEIILAEGLAISSSHGAGKPG